MYIYTYTYAHTHIYTYIYKHAHTHTYIHAQTCVKKYMMNMKYQVRSCTSNKP